MNIDLHWFSTASALSRIVYADLLYDKRNGRPSMRIVVYYCYYSVNLVSVFLYDISATATMIGVKVCTMVE